MIPLKLKQDQSNDKKSKIYNNMLISYQAFLNVLSFFSSGIASVKNTSAETTDVSKNTPRLRAR